MSNVGGQCSNGIHVRRIDVALPSLHWLDNFTDVEQEIGKAQIALGKKIIKENLQEEILLSPMDLELKKAKVTLMMDGGWDQRASGRAFNSSSGRVVSVGPLTNKVRGLVYYSKR
jgi:hypothetical protein